MGKLLQVIQFIAVMITMVTVLLGYQAGQTMVDTASSVTGKATSMITETIDNVKANTAANGTAPSDSTSN